MLGFKLFAAGLDSLAVGAVIQDVGASLSAAGTNQATATALTNALNGVATVATGAGVILYAGSAGDSQIVYNGGANAMNVFPPSGARINAIATNGAHVLAVGTASVYYFISGSQIALVTSA